MVAKLSSIGVYCLETEQDPILEAVHQLVEDIGNEMFAEELESIDVILDQE
jgi:hypothetical protein